jgi:hypothetical protein
MCRIESHPAKEITSEVTVCGGGIPEGDPQCSSGASASQGTANVLVPDESIDIGDVYMTPFKVEVTNDPNGDGLPQPGETVHIFITLINAGSADLTNVHATLTAPPIDVDQDGTDDPITIVEGEAYYEDCLGFPGQGGDCSSVPAPPQTCKNLTPFIVTVPAGHPIDVNRRFGLTLTGDIGSPNLAARPSGQFGGINVVVVTVGFAGLCGPAEQAACDDHNPCTADSCSEFTGCVHTNTNAPCDDGNSCTVGTPARADGVPGAAAAPSLRRLTSPTRIVLDLPRSVGWHHMLPDNEHLKITIPQGPRTTAGTPRRTAPASSGTFPPGGRRVRDEDRRREHQPDEPGLRDRLLRGRLQLRPLPVLVGFPGRPRADLPGPELCRPGAAPLNALAHRSGDEQLLARRQDRNVLEVRVQDRRRPLDAGRHGHPDGLQPHEGRLLRQNAVNNPMNMAVVDYFNGTPVTPHTLQITMGPSGTPARRIGRQRQHDVRRPIHRDTSSAIHGPRCAPAHERNVSGAHAEPTYTAPVNTTGKDCTIKLLVEDPFGLTAMGQFTLTVNPAHDIVV